MTIPAEKRFSIIPLQDSGTSIAVAYNFRGTLLVEVTEPVKTRYSVRVTDGEANVVREFEP